MRVRKIIIVNQHKRYKLNAVFIKRIVADILKHLKSQKELDIDLVFLDDDAIKILNKRYKGKGRPTDVLSFDLDEIGEIFISIDRALENSKAFGTRFEKEVVLYIIHGILHLFGYDDESARAKARMSAKESQILELLCRREPLSKVLMRR